MGLFLGGVAEFSLFVNISPLGRKTNKKKPELLEQKIVKFFAKMSDDNNTGRNFLILKKFIFVTETFCDILI